MPQELTSEQWAQLLSLLSLDGALPFYEAMGVPVMDKITFQNSLREVILEGRRLYESNPDQVPSISNILFQRLGSAAEEFGKWARHVFLGDHASQPDWSAWDIVFSHWAYSRRKDLDFLSEQKRNSFIAEYHRKAETNDVREKGHDLLKKPLSDWDLEMFARRGYSNSWESSPFSAIEAIVRNERLKRFAADLWRKLSLGEREELQKRAQALIDRLKVWMPGKLPSLELLLKEA